jgi:metal-responsive CopG/Arc/MetJ family transcriptional regulator
MVHKIPDDLRWELRKISVRNRQPMSEIIIDLIRDFVNRDNEMTERRKEQG